MQPDYLVIMTGLSGIISYTGWATGFHDLVTGGGHGQSSPPSVPVGGAAVMTSSTAALVTWNPATDAVGVAYYQVERDPGSILVAAGVLLRLDHRADRVDPAGRHIATRIRSATAFTSAL
jgi:hypothetical protein